MATLWRSPRRFRQLFTTFAILVFVAIWAVCGYILHAERRQVFGEARAELMGAQATLRAHMRRTIETSQTFLIVADQWLSEKSAPGNSATLPDILPLLSRLQTVDPGHMTIRMYDAEGWAIDPATGKRGLYSGDRAYIRELMDLPPGTLNFSLPFTGRDTGARLLPIAMKAHPNRMGIAFLVVCLKVQHFEQAYQNLLISAPARYSLVRLKDNRIILTIPDAPDRSDMPLKNVDLNDVIRIHGPMGMLTHEAFFGQGQRYTAYATLEHYPLLVSATFKVSDLEAKWQKSALIAIAIALVATLVMAVLSSLIITLISRYQAEAQRVALAWRDADAANRAKTDFLAKMSHELRTPLNAIIGFSEMVKGAYLGPLSSAYQQYGSDINKSGQHLLRMIDQILDISMIEAGTLEVDETTVPLAPLIDAVLTPLRPDLDSKEITVDIDPRVNSLSLMGDRRMIRQMLHKLMTNAVTHSPRGGVIRISLEESGDELRLGIADDGNGIPGETLAHIFEPFGRGDSYVARDNLGLGLGLPITKSLIELHGGRLDITSRPGKGTTATLVFPRARLYEHLPTAQTGKD